MTNPLPGWVIHPVAHLQPFGKQYAFLPSKISCIADTDFCAYTFDGYLESVRGAVFKQQLPPSKKPFRNSTQGEIPGFSEAFIEIPVPSITMTNK